MNTRSLTLNLVLAAILAVPLAAQAADTAITADGWQQVGSETLLYVGTPGKTRAQVRAELIAHQAGDSISHDGWEQVGSETLLYVGTPAATAVAARDAEPVAPIRTTPGSHTGNENLACTTHCSSIGQ